MAIVTDPDNLDRFQVLFDHAGLLPTISIRGQGTIRGITRQTGDSDGTTNFTDLSATFSTDSVAAGDVLAIISDPAENEGIIGHYVVQSVTSETVIVVDRTIPASTAADLGYKLAQPGAVGGAGQNVADGVVAQTLYSFAKEEWRTLAASLENASDLIQFNFPLVSITREQFEIGDAAPVRAVAWDWANDFTRNLIRTGGWSFVNVGGDTKQIYPGVVTLGALDTDAVVYFQQHDLDTDPVDFVLPGVVNQSVKAFDEVTGPDGGTGFAITVTNDIKRNDGGDWAVDGYEVGGNITIRAAEDVGNNGTFEIATVGAGVDGSLVVVGTPLTNNAADTTLIAAVDLRQFLELRVRKKLRTFPSSNLAAIGVATLENIVNRFPLTHSVDPAITTDDGIMSGDGTAAGDIFRNSEIVDSAQVDGVTSAPATDGTFTLTSALSGFVVDPLVPGDSMELTDSAVGDNGVYEIKSIDSATVLTCFQEPTRTFTGGESARAFTTRTGIRDTGTATATLTDVDGLTGTLDDVGATFTTDDGLGDRTVAAGDMVEVTAGVSSAIGIYKVASVTDADTLVLNTADQPITGGPHVTQTYRVFRPCMHLQFRSTTATKAGDTVAFNDVNPDTITRTVGSWITDGFTDGMAITVSNADLPANNGTYIVDTVVALTLTLIAEETLTTDASDAAAVITGENGFVRTMNAVDFPFNWRLFGNGANLTQTFEFVQRQLRRGRAGETAAEADIDKATLVKRGDIETLLMTFASPNGTMLNAFIDNLASAEFNNVTKQDITSDSRNFAFTAGVTINVNANLLTDQSAKVIVFHDDPDGVPDNGDEFGTVGAVIVTNGDGTGSPTVMRAITGGGGDNATLVDPLSFTFDYDNNNDGGRTPGTDAAVTIVGVGEDKAQYIQTTLTIARVSDNVASLVAALERNFSNPV